jgi:2-methylisocitrate lyase-like PEP mutase family enzyme
MHAGQQLAHELSTAQWVAPFLGVYDCFSATIAARYSPNLFLSGFGFAASHYGLPDVGYIAWSDMVQAAWRIRQILPEHRLMVDIDDGYVDVHTACHVVRQLDRMGAAMVMLEDQARPRRCGHADGKVILPLPVYLDKLEAVLHARQDMLVLARTDSSGDEVCRRVDAMSKTGADVLLVDGIDSVETLVRVRACTDKPLLFNQIAGGKSPQLSIAELGALGVRIIQYSTPLLFAAQSAMEDALKDLFANDGLLPSGEGRVGVASCTAMLEQMRRRGGRVARSRCPRHFRRPRLPRVKRVPFPADSLPESFARRADFLGVCSLR